VFKVAVIGDDLEGFGQPLEEVPPVLQSSHDGQQFSVVDLVVSLCLRHGFRPECDWVPESVLELLQKDPSGGVSRGVYLDSRRAVWFPGHQHRLRGEGFFEGVKRRSLPQSPFPGDVLLGEVVERSCDLSEVLDEATVEVGKPDESADLP
ncbi:uncharacterized protein TRAVEDRAFT_126041, partial [Trametes versicolor FP-101664 SS1]|uniref:uncharacterized protein n=1 Tax=Trametes versicolor (strain FP-101664) TaxID=717944 RepID=UPI0004622AD9